MDTRTHQINQSISCVLEQLVTTQLPFDVKIAKLKVLFSDIMDSSNFISFYEEISPINGKDYFYKSISNIATVTVFYNEEGFMLQKTLSSLRLQQMPKVDDHNLLLVGDGLRR